MGLEVLLAQFFGDNDALLMLGAFSILIFLNFSVEMWVEIKNNDLRWNDIGRVGTPIVLNAMFLLGLELVMIPAARVPFAYDIFVTVQTAGWLGVMAFYFYGFYNNLRKLGFSGNARIENVFEDLNKQNEEEK